MELRRLNSVWIILLLVSGGLGYIQFGLPVVEATTIYVPNDYPTIQQAVDAAGPGDTVYVYPAPPGGGGSFYPWMYHESVVINKPITLMGSNRDTVGINGRFHGYKPVVINSDGVTVRNLTVGNEVSQGEGVTLNGVSNCLIENIGSVSVEKAVYLSLSSGNIIRDIHTSNGFDVYTPIYLSGSSYNLITDNQGFNITGPAIRLANSFNNTIVFNDITTTSDNDIIYLDSSSYNVISNNSLSGGYDGIFFKSSSHNIVTNNTIHMNGYDEYYYDDNGGIRMENSNYSNAHK